MPTTNENDPTEVHPLSPFGSASSSLTSIHSLSSASVMDTSEQMEQPELKAENQPYSITAEVKQIVPPRAWNLPIVPIALQSDFTIFVGSEEAPLQRSYENNGWDSHSPDEDGDMSMIQDTLSIPSRGFAVNKAIMTQIGGAWPRMLDGTFTEGQQGVAWLPEDNPKAMELLFKYFHHKDDFPSSYLELDTLADLAIACDKYMCKTMISTWMRQNWYQPIFDLLVTNGTPTLEALPDKCALISWSLKRQQSFSKSICYVIEDIGYADGRPFFRSLDEDEHDHIYVDARLPPEVFGCIREIRKTAFEQAGIQICDLLDQRNSGKAGEHRCQVCVKMKTCRGCGDDRLCEHHEHVRRSCSRLMMGNFLDSLEKQEIFAGRMFAPPESMSLKEFLNTRLLDAIDTAVPHTKEAHSSCIDGALRSLHKRVKELLHKSKYTFPEKIQSHFAPE